MLLFGYGAGGSKRRNLVLASLDAATIKSAVTGQEFTRYLSSLPFDFSATTLVFIVPNPVQSDVLQAAEEAAVRQNIVLLEFDRSSLLPEHIVSYRPSSLQYILYHRWLASFTPLQAFFQHVLFLAPLRFEPFEGYSEWWQSQKQNAHEINYQWLWGDADGVNAAIHSTTIDPFTLFTTNAATVGSSNQPRLFVWGGNPNSALDKVGRRGFVEECFSPRMMELVSNSTMMRAGLVLGEMDRMNDYLSIFSRILVGNSDLSGGDMPTCDAAHAGIDQGIHNIITHLGLVKATFLYLNRFPLAKPPVGDALPTPPAALPPAIMMRLERRGAH